MKREEASARAAELTTKVGQLMGRLEWLGRDFAALTITRVGQLEAQGAVEPSGPAAAWLEAHGAELASKLVEMAGILDLAIGGIDDLVSEAQRILQTFPRAN